VAAGLGPAAAGLPGPNAEAGSRLVREQGGWRAWVPAAALSPFELVLAPTTPVPDLPSLDGPGRDDLAVVLVDVLGRLDALVGGPMPYLLWIHQRPFDGGDWPRAWVHLHIRAHLRSAGTPRYIAAGEIGSGVHFNPADPERAAAALRAVHQP
jgi:UDPglucose--hexose-1-phosphate uridylyltransferase